MSRQAYPEYKPSGIEWLGETPEHWEVRKLKYIASVQFSNVDKNSIDGEEPVYRMGEVPSPNSPFSKGGSGIT